MYARNADIRKKCVNYLRKKCVKILKQMIINAESLRRIRDQEGLSQKEFAKYLGISERSLQDYEGGKKIPTAKKELLQLKLGAKNADTMTQKNPTEEVRLETMIAKEVMEELKPHLEGFQMGHHATGKQLHDIKELVKTLVALLIKVKFQVDKNQEDIKEIKEYSKEMHEVVSPAK